MTSFGYYPGCSLSCGAVELDRSIRTLAEIAGASLREIDDWNCCGASAAHNLNHGLAVALPYRVLALAEAQGMRDVLAPCAACFSRLKGTAVRLGRNPALAGQMREATGREYAHSVNVISPVEFVNRLLADGLADRLKHPLGGLKVAAYYGCLLSRGEDIVVGEDAEDPRGMEAGIRAAGCQSVPWPFATECCGGGFSMSMTGAVLDLSAAILAAAREAGAEAVVTSCPMCHSNLDMRQLSLRREQVGGDPMPAVYLSELLCLAGGAEAEAIGLDRHFVDATALAGRNS
jgi:heterodisulfide reductase subunit B